MRRVMWDVEANGLLDTADTIHTLVVSDVDNREDVRTFADQEGYAPIRQGLDLLLKAETHYGHNLLRYDIPVLEKIFGIDLWDAEIMDTLVMARLRFAHIKELDFALNRQGKIPGHLIGSQGLEAWGYRLGCEKIDYTAWCESQGIEDPWALWTPQMSVYCAQDVDTNYALLDHLRKYGIPSRALEAEMDVARYLAQQERNGWPVRRDNLDDLIATLSEKKADLEVRLIEHFGSWEVPKDTDDEGNHVPFVPKVNNSRYGYEAGVPVYRFDTIEFNPNSRNHITDRLQKMYGWEPKEFTPSGQPKLDETILQGIQDEIPIAEDLEEYLLISKRLGQAASGRHSWVNYLEQNEQTGMEHIHHSIGSTTVTHRHRHSHPNLGQVPASGSPYGEECRSVFGVPEGWKLVGSDASGLELRCLAHYMARYDDGAYGKVILEGSKEDGTDIHSQNQEAAGLPTRDDAKTFIYAYLYGAGDAKIGSIVEPTASEAKQRKIGKKLRSQFERKVAALGYLSESVGRAAQRGWLRLPDDRRVYIRHQHAALNSLLQGAGAIICKWWIREFSKRLCERFGTRPGGSWDDEWAALGWIHDEVQIAVREEHAEEVAQVLRDSMETVTAQLAWRIPLAAEADIGDTWAETH